MSSFELERVSDGVQRVLGGCSLFVDASGMPHVAHAVADGQIVVASRNGQPGTPRQRETVSGPVAESHEDERVMLQIDSRGRPHVACMESGSGRLLHGVRGDDGRWAFTPVPSSLTFGGPGGVVHAAFLLHPGLSDGDMRDAPQFVFEDQQSSSLGYARSLGGT